ncbi:MAG: hypothetical protein LBO82_06575 [Synergistaceae bacterium]|jgi:hypothetical protein|nr:hypothetical protein [Synergistaceae bacterium]
MTKYRPFIPALFLYGACLDGLPYVYFQALRWIVCAFGVITALESYQNNRQWAIWLFAVVAVIFNPIAPFYLSRGAWLPIDIGAGFIFAAYGIWRMRKA